MKNSAKKISIDPTRNIRMAMVLILQRNGRYGRPRTFDRNSKVTSSQFPGLEIDLDEVFPKPPKPEVRKPEPQKGTKGTKIIDNDRPARKYSKIKRSK